MNEIKEQNKELISSQNNSAEEDSPKNNSPKNNTSNNSEKKTAEMAVSDNEPKKDEKPSISGKFKGWVSKGRTQPDFLLKILLNIFGLLSVAGLTIKIINSGLPGIRSLVMISIIIIGSFTLAWVPKISPFWRSVGAALIACLAILLRALAAPLVHDLPNITSSGLGFISFRSVYWVGLGLIIAFSPAAILIKTGRRRIYQVVTVLGCLAVLAYWLFPRGFYASSLECKDEDSFQIDNYAVLRAYKDGKLRYLCEWPTRIEVGAPATKISSIIEDDHNKVSLSHGLAEHEDNMDLRRGDISKVKHANNISTRRHIRAAEKAMISLAVFTRVALLPLFFFILWLVFRKKEAEKVSRTITNAGLGVNAFSVPIMNIGLCAAFLMSDLPDVHGVAWRGAMATAVGTIMAFSLAFAAGRALVRTLKQSEKQPEAQPEKQAEAQPEKQA